MLLMILYLYVYCSLSHQNISAIVDNITLSQLHAGYIPYAPNGTYLLLSPKVPVSSLAFFQQHPSTCTSITCTAENTLFLQVSEITFQCAFSYRQNYRHL